MSAPLSNGLNPQLKLQIGTITEYAIVVPSKNEHGGYNDKNKANESFY